MSDTHAASSLGIKQVSASDGQSVCELVVTERHLNTQGAGHGGVLFTLADAAMAIAANSGSAIAVASQASINYLAPAALGDHLTATAVHAGGTGKSRVFDVKIENQSATAIAMFRGTTIQVGQRT